MRGIAAVVPLALVACNRNLEAERAAFDRLVEQQAKVEERERACDASSGLPEVRDRWLAAYEACQPDSERTDRARRAFLEVAKYSTSGQASYERASSELGRLEAEQQKNPACVEQARLSREEAGRLRERYTPCLGEAPDPRAEEAIRRAELLAACQRCALKERCEANLERNAMVLRIRRARDEKRAKTPEQLAELTKAEREYGTELAFGCAR